MSAATAAGLPVIALAGPTAIGKTALAVELVRRFDATIVSVDSAMVYRGMDIGTAKPDRSTLAIAPHRLIDIREPEDGYSAGEFAADARLEIDAIHAAGRLPLLAGGTLLYFRALLDGLAELPPRQPAVRAALDAEAAEVGWPALHRRLTRHDPETAARIARTDRQRIQRALEVLEVSGEPLSALQKARPATTVPPLAALRIALLPDARQMLYERIERRLATMLDAGFVDEVSRLVARPALTRESPSMRAVGYRQLWAHLAGETDLQSAAAAAIVATRRLAKRQLTWLRGESDYERFVVAEKPCYDNLLRRIDGWRSAFRR
ncbi:MAG: tRNA (adenosine(37)-N6)-dimethylallyltransferase MiaA [Pseudomonadota bacterium]